MLLTCRLLPSPEAARSRPGATLLVGNICPVSLLTWVVMPVVTRALRFWLVPGRQISSARLDFIGAAASVGFLTIAALVFWLCTTQIWHLP
jgi:uncharacterized protein